MGKTLYGYAGKELWVDLTAGVIQEEDLDPQLMRKYYGGTGYCTHQLYEKIPAGADPLGEDNIIAFATSPLTLNAVPGGGSIIICAKSPATNTWGEARSGSNFGPDMKRAGYDFIFFSGRSAKPVYLEVVNGKAELKDASHLVGKDVYEKGELMRKGVSGGDPKHTTDMTIGVAGEKLSKISSIMHGDRAAGRGGLGAVMGSKRLLGIVVSGDQEVKPANPQGFKEAVKACQKIVLSQDICAQYREFGTTGDVPGCDEVGDFPTKNSQSNSFGHGAEIHDKYYEEIYLNNKACYSGCLIGCGRVVQVKQGPYQTPVHEGAEYETLAVFTGQVMNIDPELAVYCGYLCNKYGLDTISCAAVIAFAFECYEHGIITERDTGGVPLEWGNAKSIEHCLEMIAHRQYVGDILAEGVQQAAKILGQGAEKFAVHIKGLESPAHDPRAGKMLGISYATGNRGMCHIHPLEGVAYDCGKITWGMKKYGVKDPETIDRWDEEGKGKDCATLQNATIAPDILCTCKFFMYAGLGVDEWAYMLAAITGWDVDGEEMLRTGERVFNLQRLFNLREGFSRKDDALPQRILELPRFGAYAGEERCVIKNFTGMLDEYYQTRKWDLTTGAPSREKLKELGLSAYNAE